MHFTGWRSETCYARCSDVAVHGSFLRPGVSLRQGLPEVEVTLCTLTSSPLLRWVSPSCCLATFPPPCFSRRSSNMSPNGWLQFAVFSLILLASVRPVGIYLARVLEGERTWLTDRKST